MRSRRCSAGLRNSRGNRIWFVVLLVFAPLHFGFGEISVAVQTPPSLHSIARLELSSMYGRGEHWLERTCLAHTLVTN